VPREISYMPLCSLADLIRIQTDLGLPPTKGFLGFSAEAGRPVSGAAALGFLQKPIPKSEVACVCTVTEDASR
jgi:hypothetical protein